jgi:hypothetical protein
MIEQQQIAKVLRRASGRGGNGASERQVQYLAALIARSPSAEADYDGWLLDGEALTKGTASSLIEIYQNEERRAALTQT